MLERAEEAAREFAKLDQGAHAASKLRARAEALDGIRAGIQNMPAEFGIGLTDVSAIAVSRLWRYPVKSMVGTEVAALRIDRRGVHADRLWAVRDLDNDITATGRPGSRASALHRRIPHRARAGRGTGQRSEVLITFPDGVSGAAPTPTSTSTCPGRPAGRCG